MENELVRQQNDKRRADGQQAMHTASVQQMRELEIRKGGASWEDWQLGAGQKDRRKSGAGLESFECQI